MKKRNKRRKRCDYCGQLKDDVFKSQDPYAYEMGVESLEDNPETNWCDDCYSDAVMDI